MATNKYIPKQGIICLIDALGAKAYSEEDTVNFLKSREVIRKAIEDKCEEQIDSGNIDDKPYIAFFNVTIIITMEFKQNLVDFEYKYLKAMGYIVRKLISDGISKKILYRGAISVGRFFLDSRSNTIIGQAIADAESWYESTEMIGCILTPRTYLILEKHRITARRKLKHIFIDYDVPLKTGKQMMVCINWPKAFYVPSIKPDGCVEGKELQYLYTKLGENIIPKNTESKYYNTIEFFKYSSTEIKRDKKLKSSRKR